MTLWARGEDRPDEPARPMLLALDGDGLIHRAHHGMVAALGEVSADRDADGRPTWALRGLVTSLAVAAARLRPDAVVVALDSRVDPVRKAKYPDYKAHRPPREPDLQAQLDAAPGLLADGGVPHACVEGHEGDDVLASAAAGARAAGWGCVVVTSDRDAFALVDATTSVLRVVDGGVDAGPLLTPRSIEALCGVPPSGYRDLAALRGDPSDNLPGVPGVGAKTAARLLRAFGSAREVFAALDDGRAGDVEAAVGTACVARLAEPGARAAVDRNLDLMAMREDLPLPDLARTRLPLHSDRLLAALRARGIALGPSLWALVGGEPPPWEPNGFDKAPATLPAVSSPPWALGSPLPTLAELAARRQSGRRDEPAAKARPARRTRVAPAVPAGQLSLF